MQRIWRQLFATVIGLVAFAGAASAQSQPPRPLPPLPPLSAIPVASNTLPALPAPSGLSQTSGGFNGPNPVSLHPWYPGRIAVQVHAQPPIPYGSYGEGCAN